MDKELEELMEYEKRLTEHNDSLIAEFKKWMQEKGLSEKVIEKHVGNIRFFANQYLVRYQQDTLEDGVIGGVGDFMSNYFPFKCAWANKSSINDYISGFNKFYGFLAETDRISKDNYLENKQMMKEEKQFWLRLV